MQALVDTDWLAARLGDPSVRVVQIDREDVEGYPAGHIPGAVGWQWKAALWHPVERRFPDPDDFAARMGAAGIGPDTTVVLYGVPVQYGTYGWWVLRLCGHRDVRLLDGGLTKWRREGRPVTTEAPAVTPVAHAPPEPDERVRAGREAVLRALDDPRAVLLDHRSAEEYAGTRVNIPGPYDHGAERGGRIPGARHVPFDTLLNGDDSFRSAEALGAIFAPHVPDRDTPVICYCRLSHRATLARFAMTELLGYRNVRVYDGSWTEWGSMVGMPIER